MFSYGFELEGFAHNKSTNEVDIPPRLWPTDGFPGLLEIRTTGGKSLVNSYFELLKGLYNLDTTTHIPDFETCEHKFSGKDHAGMRRDRVYQKDQLDIMNVYGKEPRALNGRTLASFQINVSYCLQDSFEVEGKDSKRHIPARYGLLDITGIVKRLDTEFKEVIAASKRQPGMYAIKDTYRLEYRSLPNFVFEDNFTEIKKLLARIKKAVENG